MVEPEDTRGLVRSRYAQAAAAVMHGSSASCGDPTAGAGDAVSCDPAAEPLEVDERFGAALYDPEHTRGLPTEAVLASLGCGNPTAVADLRSGERVLDLGSGGGIDVLLSARRVGPTGFAYGVDMTVEMLRLARANAANAGAANVAFLKGTIEDIPLPDASVDVVISNCVINLSVDKPAVLREMFRVLVAGGRIGISDVVADDELTPADRAARGSYVGCIAGALSRGEYLAGLADAGFVDASVEFTHEAAPGLHGAIIHAAKLASAGRGADQGPDQGPDQGADRVPDLGADRGAGSTTDDDRAGRADDSVDSCCSATAAGSCCAPAAKSSCCGDPAAVLPSSCGCR